MLKIKNLSFSYYKNHLVLDDVSTNRTYMPIQSSQLANNNRASFVSFNAQGEPVFANSVDLFQGSTRGYSHLGIVIDYYVESLEYLYSLSKILPSNFLPPLKFF